MSFGAEDNPLVEWGEEKSGPPVFSMSAPWTLDDDTEAAWLMCGRGVLR